MIFKGRLLEDIGPLMPMHLIIIDNGEAVDTVSFKRVPYTFNEMKQILEAYRLATCGIKNQDIELLGHATTISAKVNQRRHYKREFNDILNILPELERTEYPWLIVVQFFLCYLILMMK